MNVTLQTLSLTFSSHCVLVYGWDDNKVHLIWLKKLFKPAWPCLKNCPLILIHGNSIILVVTTAMKRFSHCIEEFWSTLWRIQPYWTIFWQGPEFMVSSIMARIQFLKLQSSPRSVHYHHVWMLVLLMTVHITNWNVHIVFVWIYSDYLCVILVFVWCSSFNHNLFKWDKYAKIKKRTNTFSQHCAVVYILFKINLNASLNHESLQKHSAMPSPFHIAQMHSH